MKIPFNKPYLTGKEISYIKRAAEIGQLSGDGFFTKQCRSYLEDIFLDSKVLLTHSCTGALEIAALLLDLKPGDEVIIPSYTFVSTANAFVLRGAKVVFVDIDPNTLCIDLDQAAAAISPRTRAIVCVHYAGVSCNMDHLLDLKKQFNISVIEDAAQALDSFYKDRPLGSFGDMATFSFHETKNVISGEGGCLVINNSDLVKRAEIIREKGTNRTQFFRGEVDKYTWVDIGSSYLPGELISAFLYAQLQHKNQILDMRLKIWKRYFYSLSSISRSRITLPASDPFCKHNAHMFYIICNDIRQRSSLISYLADHDIHAVFHYIPLHSSPAGLSCSSTFGDMKVTDHISQTLLRLPLYPDLSLDNVDFICQKIEAFFDA